MIPTPEEFNSRQNRHQSHVIGGRIYIDFRASEALTAFLKSYHTIQCNGLSYVYRVVAQSLRY